MPNFESFELLPAILKAITELGFEKPTPVQRKVLPALLKGTRDLVALAQTGTGKTAAYGLPLLQHVDTANPATQALILCPTRELCMQIAKDLSRFAKHLHKVRILAVYGGTSIGEQIGALKAGVHIVVATPGRMNDLLERKRAHLSQVKRVVLDEADEMMNMGFQEELEAILGAVPEGVQTLLFSATMPKQVATIAGKYMHDPEEIVIGQRNAGAENVTHECYKVHAKDRYPALKRILDYYREIYGIVFCRTRIETQEVAAKLMGDGYSADALHGDMSQDQRDRVMRQFRSKHLQILVATDVAARGLDVTNLTHVINYNLPDEPEGYTHRSGRTGRAGKEGVSIIIANMREEYKIRAIEQIVKKKFVHKLVPSGREVCESQLMGLLERIKQMDISDRRIDSFMPAIAESLGEMPMEEVLKRVLMLEFSRFLDYYKEAPDLNQQREQRHGGAHERPHERERVADRSSGGMVALEINLGRRNNLTPPALIGTINRATPGPKVRLGRIKIMGESTVFEVSADEAQALAASLNRASYYDRKICVRPYEEGASEPAHDTRGARGVGGHKDAPPRHGERRQGGHHPPRR